MSVLLQINQISKRYGARTLLKDATASFARNQKIGVIGRNGAGKSTLCKIIIGQEEMDAGTISTNADLRLSYLEQQDSFRPDESVLDFLKQNTGKEAWECGEMAARFQLANHLLQEPVTALAGGYQTRVKLTAMLLKDPNFLILDEPSNYLDLSTLILLENFLLNFNGGYLIVSHDREFLKRTCEHTLEVEDGCLNLYPGNIEDYFEFKEEILRQKIAYNKTVEKKKEQMQVFVDRFRAKAATASRAKSKLKQMAKLKTIEIAHASAQVRIRIPPVEKKKGVALSCQGLSIGYPEKIVVRGIDLEVERGVHIAVLGNNGEGKTTFLRTLAGDLAPREGRYQWGAALKVAYYAQHVFRTLHPQDDVYTHLQREAAEGVTRQDVLDMAGCFLFQGDDVKKKVAVLSGGEQARLCLAGLLLSKSHILLLDEPTNHLDFDTVEALGNALKSFDGTLFFISHDRTFVNLIATSILEIKGGRLSRYPGTYEDYVYHLEIQAQKEAPGGTDNKDDTLATDSEEGDEFSPQTEVGAQADSREAVSSDMRKKAKAEISRLKNKVKKAEVRLKYLNQKKEDILEHLRQNPFHYSKTRKEGLKVLNAKIEEEELLCRELRSQVAQWVKQRAGG